MPWGLGSGPWLCHQVTVTEKALRGPAGLPELLTRGVREGPCPRTWLYLVKQLSAKVPVLGAVWVQQCLGHRAIQDSHCDFKHLGI